MLSLWLLCIFLRSVHPDCGYRHPPDLQETSSIGCDINEIRATAAVHPGWQVRVWATYQNRPRWSHLFSVRGPHEELKAMRDCYDWKKHIRQDARAEERKANGN